MIKHKCDEGCYCIEHQLLLIYSPSADEHSCQNPDCKYAHGYEKVLQAEMMAAEARRRIERDHQRKRLHLKVDHAQ